MSELISGKEALIALANGEDVQKRSTGWAGGLWLDITEKEPFNLSCFFSGINRHGEEIEFRLKPKTITLNGIEVPKIPVKADLYANGNSVVIECDNDNDADILRDALRSIFKGE